MVVVVALAATDAQLALAVVLLYGLAYTLELAVALALYFSGQPGRLVKRLSALASDAACCCCRGRARVVGRGRGGGKFNPEHDFDPGEWIPIHLGPLDLSINKTVAYLILGTIVTIALGLFLMRARIGAEERGRQEPGRRRDRLRHRADPGRRAGPADTRRSRAGSRTSTSLMLFIWVINMLGFIPLPLSNEKFTVPGTSVELPTLAHLRRHVFDQRHAGARADDLRSSRTSRGSATTAHASTSGAGFPTCRRRSCR